MFEFLWDMRCCDPRMVVDGMMVVVVLLGVVDRMCFRDPRRMVVVV